ncbi:AAA family ATPase [Cognatishimia sp. MH4019]|uniref:AAA family ATPase n=1 Tax=Cognatishimia sp. MH4019 TaxID=2854030 RepID=UPI001CD51CAA|nr:AAA family ATPase [Cognatishimia sp. MH4019]
MAGTDFDTLLRRIEGLSPNAARCLIAIAGPPASGKSTLAAELAEHLGAIAMVLPMDGFHLDNAELSDLGLLDRKGAPETFDAQGFVDLVQNLRETPVLTVPTFDRAADKTIPAGDRIGPDTQIVLIEGNYLLLNTTPWAQLKNAFDLTVSLRVEHDELERRLVERWYTHGLSHRDALKRARENDLRNADFVDEHSYPADVVYLG